MKYFTTILLLLTFTTNSNAQKDSFWVRNLNLMGEPKAVFALDDGYSIVLADSFDQISKQYKGIIFFKLDPNGKTVKRKQLFELDTAYIEQRVEKAEKLNDGYLFRWFYTYNKNDSLVKSKSYFAKIDSKGEIFQNEETVVNYFGKAGIYWYLLNKDTILDLPIPNKSGLLRYSSIKSGLKIDSFKGKPFPPTCIQNKRLFFISKKRKDNYDSIWITSFNFKYERIKRITININSELDIFNVAEFGELGWLLRAWRCFLDKTRILIVPAPRPKETWP